MMKLENLREETESALYGLTADDSLKYRILQKAAALLFSAETGMLVERDMKKTEFAKKVKISSEARIKSYERVVVFEFRLLKN